ncbi:MAG: methylamine utilization protein MauG [Gammaproteobacteria bacterium]|nr:MAG: methylamine utilization protein MauG [Pseudomonadota bacterium]PIE38884.1 MAG: methylamine utilization protein MauG [Gammaproteobacteria bacterium]
MKAATIFLVAVTTLLHTVSAPADQRRQSETDELNNKKAALGQRLFFDVNLSKNRTQSCATCHDPARGFSDHRGTGAASAVSLGDDGKSLGDRNAPTASYAAFSPLFHKNGDDEFVGGQFLDGRASSLADQAGGPPLNPVEMGMPDKAGVIARIQADVNYQTAFKNLYGDTVFERTEDAYAAMTDAIATFEKTDFFSPFTSKYDRYLRGEYQFTEQEELGRTLFFSQQFTNCNLCHQLRALPGQKKETFSNYEYHNIGVPVNTELRAINGVTGIDQGLLNNPAVTDPAQRGKYKTPTLRNVAVTGPYMHNGVFRDLRTVVLFYNKYNSRSAKRQINPETGNRWREPEVPDTLSMEELETGPALDNKRIDALVAFLKTLTDKRYEQEEER